MSCVSCVRAHAHVIFGFVLCHVPTVIARRHISICHTHTHHYTSTRHSCTTLLPLSQCPQSRPPHQHQAPRVRTARFLSAWCSRASRTTLPLVSMLHNRFVTSPSHRLRVCQCLLSIYLSFSAATSLTTPPPLFIELGSYSNSRADVLAEQSDTPLTILQSAAVITHGCAHSHARLSSQVSIAR